MAKTLWSFSCSEGNRVKRKRLADDNRKRSFLFLHIDVCDFSEAVLSSCRNMLKVNKYIFHALFTKGNQLCDCLSPLMTQPFQNGVHLDGKKFSPERANSVTCPFHSITSVFIERFCSNLECALVLGKAHLLLSMGRSTYRVIALIKVVLDLYLLGD